MYLMTSFTAKSLVHLTSLVVRNCGMLEEFVMTKEGESEQEITFESLKDLELTCLSHFKSFCMGKHTFIFPSLVTMKVTRCYKMQNFSYGITVAPFLKLVEVENGKNRWKGDLNTTIKHLFIGKTNENLNMDVTGAPSSKEQVGQAKHIQIADTSKQETHKLPREYYYREQNEKHLAQVIQNASIPSTNQDTESQYAMTQSSKCLFKQATTVNNKESLAKGTQDMGQNIERPLVEGAIALRPTGVYDAAIGTQEIHDTLQTDQDIESLDSVPSTESHDLSIVAQEMCDTIKKPSISTAQNVPSSTMIPNAATMSPSPSQAPELSTAQNTEASYDPYMETQKICETIKKPSSPTAQNVPKATMIPNAITIDPSPSKASEPMTSSILESNTYGNYNWLNDISKQNLPYLEVGLERHPQVLDWFNAKRRRVFATLFTEVTRILRSTRRCDLIEDDRNYIKECCAALEAVGFDASWLSYVYGCIESCGDGDELKRKLEETEAKASTLRNELASVEASLVSL